MINRRGQMTLVSLLLITVTLIMFAALLPVIVYAIDIAMPNLSGMSAAVMELVPLFMLFGVVITIFTYSSAQRAGR